MPKSNTNDILVSKHFYTYLIYYCDQLLHKYEIVFVKILFCAGTNFENFLPFFMYCVLGFQILIINHKTY